MWRPLLEDLVPPTRWPELGWRLYLAIALLLIFLPPLACQAVGAGPFTHAECQALARFILRTAEVRDLGAQLDKHVALVRRTYAAEGIQLSPIVEGEMRRAYAERLAPEKAEESAYQRCMTLEILRKAS